MTIREPICGRLVCLAPLSVETAPDWLRWMGDPETTRYLYAPGEEPRTPHTLESLQRWGRTMLADPRRLVFALCDRESGDTIGEARLAPGRRGRARFSIMIGEPGFRGRGMGAEATGLVCRYAFDELAVGEVVLDVDPRNRAAIAAYLAVGFEHCGGTRMRLRPRP